MRKLPSAWSIVWTDNVSYMLTSIGPVLFVLALMIKLTGTVPGGRGKPDQPVDPEFANLVLASAAALLAFFGALVSLRVARIRSLFDSGEEVEATVRKVSRFKGGATLRLEFQRGGQAYKVRSTFKRWSQTPEFTAGDRLALLVNPANPKRAVPVALYERTTSAKVQESGGPTVAPPSAQAWPVKAFGLQLS
jgi:hypothetical protein